MSKDFKKLTQGSGVFGALGAGSGSHALAIGGVSPEDGVPFSGKYSLSRMLSETPRKRKPLGVVPIPDEMELARKARNAEARKKRKGRASTVLTDFGYDVMG